jgi:cytochrome c1
LREGEVTGVVRFVAMPTLVLTCMVLSACTGGEVPRAYNAPGNGNAKHGRQLIEAYGCGACHIIPGVHAARGLVGPPLILFGGRTMIAGELPNTPENLELWIENPRAIEPQTAMPDLGLNGAQAADIAAYLYKLR